jgi:DNA-binding NarL/FixJ family response regulator
MITKRILIADDDPLVRNVLRFFLESQKPFKVCGEAVNGLDVIEKAKALSPDLVVMDVSMPVMNGIEAGSVLKVMLPHVPVVLYTSQDSATIEIRALEVGVRAVIQKSHIAHFAGHLGEFLS